MQTMVMVVLALALVVVSEVLLAAVVAGGFAGLNE